MVVNVMDVREIIRRMVHNNFKGVNLLEKIVTIK